MMRILISNDDGINAPGLEVLIEIAKSLSDDLWVVAPEVNQSGAGHSLTFRSPLRLRQLDAQRFAVNGTPTDCVLVAMQHILRGQKVDLMLSGVNHGGNLGEDVTYSGTVAAAMEATLFDIRAVAMSQRTDFKGPTSWSTAAHWGPRVLKKLVPLTWPRGVLMNVNFPACAPEEVRGIAVARQGQRRATDQLLKRDDPFGEPYYWIGVDRDESEREEGTDLHATHEGHVSVTPVNLDMTDHDCLKTLEQSLG
jgi:5'-nucleotidase